MSIQRRPRRCIVDAEGRSLGRVAAEAARLLQGKNEPYYVPHQDVGSWVQVRNIKKAKFTGRKFNQKVFHHYSGYPGGLTTRSLLNLWAKRPESVIRAMVYHMLPTNTLRKAWIKRLVDR